MEYLEGYWDSLPQWTRTQLLLSTSGEVGSFVVGDRVRMRYGVEGEVGEVVEIEDGQIRVCFPNCDRWHGLASELLPAAPVVDNLQVGSKVRVCALRPICGWGKVAPGEIGEVVQLHWGVVMVRFPQEPKWYGKRSEVELVDTFALGGHEADWVNPDAAKEFECPICMKVCSNPLMHSCCQIFCELCWKECQKSDARCPICRDMEEPAVPAYRCRKEIEKLELRCPRGCGATFPLLQKEMLLQHLECSFQQADGCNAELQETQEIRQECELCQSSSDDHIATLWQEVQVLTARVKRMEEALKVLKDSKSN